MKGARRIGRLAGAGLYLSFTCPQCGKPFPVSCCKDDWTFRYMGACLCSWTCLRAWERKHPRKRDNFYLDYLA